MFNLFTSGKIGSLIEFKLEHIDLVKITRENPENSKDISQIHKNIYLNCPRGNPYFHMESFL